MLPSRSTVPRRARRSAAATFALTTLSAACHHAPPAAAPAPHVAAPTLAAAPTPAARAIVDFRTYAGVDDRGLPHYVTRVFSDDERALLRTTYGVDDPNRLYLSDSSAARVLKYDTQPKRCRTCYVNSYRVGFVSVRRRGESWDTLETRVRRLTPREAARAFGPAAREIETSIRTLDPDVAPAVARLVDDAARAGFHVRVAGTYRTPEREAYYMAVGGGRTHTLTSLHSYGRAVDVELSDEHHHPVGRARWIAFRRWLVAYPALAVRLVGTPAATWDWRHLDLPGPEGFRSVDEALARARACTTPSVSAPRSDSAPTITPPPLAHPVSAAVPCDFLPHLPTSVTSAR